MYKLLIAEDEGIERKAFRMFIHKNFPMIEVLPDATNGMEALELAKLHMPDIMVVDIEMPEINGIDLIRLLRKNGIESKIIVHTAYNYFEYAKDALNFGADAFILKPLKHSELQKTIEDCIRKIDEQHKEQEKKDLVLNNMISFAEQELLTAIIRGKVEEEKMRACFKSLDIGYKSGFFITVKIPYEQALAAGGTPIEQEMGFGRIRDYAVQVMAHKTKVLVSNIAGNQFSIYVPTYESNILYHYKLKLLPIINAFVQEVADLTSIHVNVGIGSLQQDIGNLRQSYEESIQALFRTSFKNRVVFYDEMQDDESAIRYEPMQRHLKKIVARYERGQAQKNMEDMVEQFLSNEEIMLRQVKEWAMCFLFILYDETREKDENQNDDYFSISQNFSAEIYRLESRDEIRGYLLRQIETMLHTRDGKHSDKINGLVEKAVHYINMNYREDISLDIVADEVGISSYYLSHLFKKELKHNFIDYLNDVRIKKIIGLIQQKNYTIKELSELSGFKEHTYLCKVVKKQTGKTVGELKRIYRQQDS